MSVTLPRLWGRQSQVVRERKGETNIETKKNGGKKERVSAYEQIIDKRKWRKGEIKQ